ncbi:hypothetical protein [Nocardia sp. NBC_01327]|uniref:hypothetical protein n=1 Tax=Nocardia sp. NBC_01327 TaxID=2903593 RepID=UPI002E0F7DA6|nr:hypothetical protein OG326_42175 [Nocardia sp. NBC_01327]
MNRPPGVELSLSVFIEDQTHDGLYSWLRKRYVLVDPDHQRMVDRLLLEIAGADPQPDDLPHDQ